MDEVYILDAISDNYGIAFFTMSQSWRAFAYTVFAGLVVLSTVRYVGLYAISGVSGRNHVVASAFRYAVLVMFLLLLRDYQLVFRGMAQGLVEFGQDIILHANSSIDPGSGEMAPVRADQVLLAGIELAIEVVTKNGLFSFFGPLSGLIKFFLAIFIVWGAFRVAVAVIRSKVEVAFADVALSVGISFAPNEYSFGLFKGSVIFYVEAFLRYMFTLMFVGGGFGLFLVFSEAFSIWEGISFWDALVITGGVWCLGEMVEQVPAKAASAMAGSLSQDWRNPFQEVSS